jgi:hypothetical protein
LGASVAVTYHGNKEKAEEVCHEIGKTAKRPSAFGGDLSDFDAARA